MKDFFKREITPTIINNKATITTRPFIIPGRGTTHFTNQSKKVFPSSETLLRALLEISTYFKKLDQSTFKKEFNCNDKSFQLVLLLENGTVSYKQAEKLTENYNTLFKSISKLLECPILICGFEKIGTNNDGKLKDFEFKVEVIKQFFPSEK